MWIQIRLLGPMTLVSPQFNSECLTQVNHLFFINLCQRYSIWAMNVCLGTSWSLNLKGELSNQMTTTFFIC
jgi:hypothetical protein